MLGIDHQHADIGTIEPGADPGVFGRQRGGRIRGAEAGGGVRLGEPDAAAARYEELKRSGRGLVRRYVEKMTGLSRAQMTRLITVYLRGEEVKPQAYRRRRFPRATRGRTSSLLASVDEAHETLSGPATQKILQRACYDFDDKRYQSLARISVAHLYRLRASRAYRERRIEYQATRPTPVSIGERRKPDPQGRPGYLRIDTVHQGDQDGVKGVYHINAVDEVTQWQVVGAAAQISEAFLLPVLEAMLEQFPFRIRGFHSDNGSEFINHMVAELLNKLLIEQTKSRPRHSNDNGLVETKNGAVMRKHMGHTHIAAAHAAGDRGLLPRALQSVPELSSAVRSAGVGGERQRARRRECTAGMRRRGRSCGSCRMWLAISRRR